MLSLREVHNMGLNGRGGFWHHSGDQTNVYGRGIYGVLVDGVDNAGGLSDFLHNQSNPFLQASLLPHADHAVTTSSSSSLDILSASASAVTYSSGLSMGFTGVPLAEIDRSHFFDVEVMPQTVHDHFNFPVSIVTTTVQPFDSIPCLGNPGLVPLQPSRESWLEEATAPDMRGVKREAAPQDYANLQPRKKVETLDHKLCKRPSDQADHILRERHRRDDMTSKFAVLESLLPTAPKRDRSTIVDDSIEYVKNLHHRIKLLQKRREELAHPGPNVAGQRTSTGTTTTTGPLTVHLPSAAQIASSPNMKTPLKSPVSQEEMNRIRAVLGASLESMQVHTDMPNQVVINMVCRPHPRLQSNILQCLESLDLDVMQCSITKVFHRLICVITAKPQGATTPTSDVVAALKYALGSDVQT